MTKPKDSTSSLSQRSVPCPGCGGEKLKTSLLCRACRDKAIVGPGHPQWKARPICPACGARKNGSARTCHACYLQGVGRFEDGRHVAAKEWQRVFRRTPAGRRYVRAMNLRKFGLTPEDYDAMLTAQGGTCAACGRPEVGRNQYGIVALAVDHDHATGRVRGLLCMQCNRALGLLGDSPERLRQLLAYREKGGDALYDHAAAA